MSTLIPSDHFVPMAEADALAQYGPYLDMARLFEYCDKQAARTERIGAYSFFLLHYISNAQVTVVDGAFVVGDDIAETWSDEKYSANIHNVNVYMNEEYAKGFLHPWLVKACEGSRGWSWHTHAPVSLPTVREVISAKIRRSVARMSRLTGRS